MFALKEFSSIHDCPHAKNSIPSQLLYPMLAKKVNSWQTILYLFSSLKSSVLANMISAICSLRKLSPNSPSLTPLLEREVSS